ncbi:MAG: endonuclease III [Bacteroidales bacterium]|nr:endonuclease III [Bacteroidales bacterium]
MRRKERYTKVLEWFAANMPEASSELRYGSPFQLLVAVMLSAQCTDKRINMVTPALFSRFPDAASMAASSQEEIYGFIKSVSYPNSKAAHLLEMSRKLVSDFGGEVPAERAQLQALPGVGRKTANVVTSIIYDAPVIAVDTHVFRISHRLGLSEGKDPLAVEKDLTAGIPEAVRPKAHHWLLLHGRHVCTSRNPKCSCCGLSPYCKEFNNQLKDKTK